MERTTHPCVTLGIWNHGRLGTRGKQNPSLRSSLFALRFRRAVDRITNHRYSKLANFQLLASGKGGLES